MSYPVSDTANLSAARERGVRARMHLLEAEGGTLTVKEVAERLGTVQREVEERRRAGRLVAFPMPHVWYVYPAWQFGADGTLPALNEILAALDVRNPWQQAAFFLAKNVYLNGASPLAELRRGNVAAVRRAAEAYGEHGSP
jgi:hypothetical protein